MDLTNTTVLSVVVIAVLILMTLVALWFVGRHR